MWLLTIFAQEMASDELKEMRKNMTKEAIREHQIAKTGGTETDLFSCGKCKKKNCTYTQVSFLIQELFCQCSFFSIHDFLKCCVFFFFFLNKGRGVYKVNAYIGRLLFLMN